MFNPNIFMKNKKSYQFLKYSRLSMKSSPYFELTKSPTIITCVVICLVTFVLANVVSMTKAHKLIMLIRASDKG